MDSKIIACRLTDLSEEVSNLVVPNYKIIKLLTYEKEGGKTYEKTRSTYWRPGMFERDESTQDSGHSACSE